MLSGTFHDGIMNGEVGSRIQFGSIGSKSNRQDTTTIDRDAWIIGRGETGNIFSVNGSTVIQTDKFAERLITRGDQSPKVGRRFGIGVSIISDGACEPKGFFVPDSLLDSAVHRVHGTMPLTRLCRIRKRPGSIFNVLNRNHGPNEIGVGRKRIVDLIDMNKLVNTLPCNILPYIACQKGSKQDIVLHTKGTNFGRHVNFRLGIVWQILAQRRLTDQDSSSVALGQNRSRQGLCRGIKGILVDNPQLTLHKLGLAIRCVQTSCEVNGLFVHSDTRVLNPEASILADTNLDVDPIPETFVGVHSGTKGFRSGGNGQVNVRKGLFVGQSGHNNKEIKVTVIDDFGVLKNGLAGWF